MSDGSGIPNLSLRSERLLTDKVYGKTDTLPNLSGTGHSLPGLTASSPSAFGASFGGGFGFVNFQHRTRYTNKPDGAVGVGLGLGDPGRYVGFDVAAVSFSSFRQGFAHIGAIDVLIHRILPGNFAVALGREGAITWGGTDVGASSFAVVSRWFTLKSDPKAPLSGLLVNAGIGGGRFQSERKFQADAKNANFFGSVALRVAEPVAVIADWTGQDVLLGGSVAPLRHSPLIFTVGVNDLTRNAGDGPRLVLGLGYTVNVLTLLGRR